MVEEGNESSESETVVDYISCIGSLFLFLLFYLILSLF